MDAIEAPVIFANAMWRSGSTYLASRFAQSRRYLLYYEPCHEGVGRPAGPRRTRDRARVAERRLNHPDIGSGYFDSYDLVDPRTERRLAELYPFPCAIRDVYRDAAPATISYLAACVRVAEARGRTAFLGFCRAGTQHRSARDALGGLALHLWRGPREQWQSYNWPDNDYFVPGTILQLLLSPRFRLLALSFIGDRLGWVDRLLAELMPDRLPRIRYRVGRRIAAGLTPATCYALFYLSWRICYDDQSSGAIFSFSLTRLAEDESLRRAVAERFAIDFPDLRPTPSAYADNLPYDEIEAEVERRLAEYRGTAMGATLSSSGPAKVTVNPAADPAAIV